jgi:hypothetical protein
MNKKIGNIDVDKFNDDENDDEVGKCPDDNDGNSGIVT